MKLTQIIKATEGLGCEIIFLENLDEDGRYDKIYNKNFIFVKADLDDNAKINVILHERVHLKNHDTENILSQLPAYSHRLENVAERDRIVDFMNLINTTYPIDKSFNYINYMKNALIPDKYENLVKETAEKLYQENKAKKLI
ncbi:ImmA/IrrE family metallo-endopeptidase [Streptococcus sp. H49]|uniref:ImmA/IrrE family metallo-endopeptidase n=1 Tax=Streptococcus huangxiaojuni TaxID=3237239 RepID=UPI0034A29852